jgi:VanZ family protein
MHREHLSLRLLLLGIVGACLAFLLFSSPDTGGSRILGAGLNCGHFPLFGVIAVSLFFFFELGRPQGLKNHAMAWGLTALMGLVTECIQLFQPQRFFELRDLANDALGAFTFLAFIYSFKITDGRWRNGLRVILVLICLAVTIPIWQAVAEWRNMVRSFPLIGSFESVDEMKRWHTIDATLALSHQHATQGSLSAEVHLLPGEYPGITSDYFYGDWRGFQNLALDVYLPGTTPVTLRMRINDKHHNQEHSDRYNQSVELVPGLNHIRIPLSYVAAAPRNRPMDIQAITLICLFVHGLEKPCTIYIDNIRLL